MLKLDRYITLDEDAVKSPNLCDRFSDDDLKRIGSWVHAGFLLDKGSRAKWEKRNEAGMDLAMQVSRGKNFPWPGCSNIAFPLVTIAALQFHARAYPAIIQGADVVKCRVIGPDDSGEKTQRAERVSCHMSYQVLEEDQCWEPEHDRLLINLPIVGSAFKKSRYSPKEGHNRSELVLAKDLVLDYWAKTVEDCPRKTHMIPLFRNDLYERAMRGTFRRGLLEEPWFSQPASPRADTQQVQQDNRQGLTTPASDETTPFMTLEQHVNVDLDNDGYAEPYVITVEAATQCTLRIVTRFDSLDAVERNEDGDIIQIRAWESFTKYSFIPSPDGGIYDIGFGVFLGPLNESVNSIINQLTDAGTMSNAAGGFLGRGAKIRGGVYTFAPLEWKRVDSTGDDLRKSIFPLPVREPSTVLFQLLALLIDYTNRVSGSMDIMVGENPGQNTPAETSRTLVEQGMKIYSSVFKRVWRSMKEEFKKLYLLNAQFLPIRSYYGDKNALALREDYMADPGSIVPAADPNITSNAEAFAQARAVKESSMTSPGYNRDAVERRYLKAMKVDNIDEVFPGSDKLPPGESEKISIQKMKLQEAQLKMQGENAQFAAKLMEEQRKNNAQIALFEAQAMKAVADIQGDQRDREIAEINAMIGLLKHRNDTLSTHIEAVLRAMEIDNERRKADVGGVSGLGGPSSDASSA